MELIVSLTLLGVVAAMMLATLRDQQRFQVGMLQIIDAKRNAHHAVDLLYTSLRGSSSRDLYAITDSSVAFRATIGATHICAIDSGRTSLALPSTAQDTSLSTFLTMPRAGDSLLIFDPGDSAVPDDDRWTSHILRADLSGDVCPERPAGLSARVGGAQGVGITITPPVSATAFVGSPIRFFRPTRYSLYRGTGAEWMLGYSTCAAGTCTTRQPVSGAYLPFSSSGGSGVAFQYFDARGSPTSDPRSVARIEVVARTRSTSPISAAHLQNARYADSAALTIALRNTE
jgi:type II secretory pathway pseudopilin PulG